MTRREALGLGALATGAMMFRPLRGLAQAKHRFDVEGDHFVLDGKPLQVLSGEMHYARIPRAYWRNRIQMAKAMGLNTIATYIFWNCHEPRPGQYDFTDNNDVATFIKTIHEEGMHVLLRAGPYSCAEWEFGGFPAWLLKEPKMETTLRTKDPSFMGPVATWMKRLGKELGPLQADNGGPILATQIENEYGNFSNDHEYMKQMMQVFLDAGFTKSMLYTVDPSKALANGEIDGVYSGVNFGTGNAEGGLAKLEAQRPGAPLFSTEYWPGWFDLWGHPHETRKVEPQLKDLEYIMSKNASLNIYMVHGGTSFGMMAGASASTGSYRGNVTSYDYDAPIDEAGHPAPKFHAYRDVLLKHTGEKKLPIPETPPVISIPAFTLANAVPLWAHMPKPVMSEDPLTMEQVDQAYGYILYRMQLKKPLAGGRLKVEGLKDFAVIYVDGNFAGTLDRHFNEDEIVINSNSPAPRIDILVENTGRLNSTKAMRRERKGISMAVLDGTVLKGWQMYSFPMDTMPLVGVSKLAPSMVPIPHFAAGTFTLQQVGDSFLDTRSLGKGLLWINGRCLGRFWNIGPQGTLYLPGAWLKKGVNQVVIFDILSKQTTAKLEGLKTPILDAKTPAYDTDGPKRDDGEFGQKLAKPADAPK